MDVSHLTIENEGNSNRKIVNGTYRIVKKIGQGQYGKVMLAELMSNDGSLASNFPKSSSSNSIMRIHSNSSGKRSSESDNEKKYVAIKTINRIDKTRLITKTYLSHTTKIKREILIMKECKHPNVVQLHQVIDDLKFDKILLVLEYCRYGEVDWKNYNHYHEKHNKDGKGLTLNRLLRDVLNGLDYLHNHKHIIHRDLKPSNLLISADKTIKISDFGVSLILENNANDEKELGKTMGTPAFFAPELCQFVNNRLSMLNDADRLKSRIDNRIDLWSLGVILYCLVFHNLPFNGSNEFSLFKKIVTEPLKFPHIKTTSKTTLEDVNELKLIKDLVTKLLTKDPCQRLSLRDIKQHAFTTYDLANSKQISEFMEFNKKLISSQAKASNPDVGLTTKIKKFFTGQKTTAPTPPTSLILQQQREHSIKEQKLLNDPTSLSNLEPVDDLLNSYFDDSSSMGSLENEETEPYNTSDVLGSLNDERQPELKKDEEWNPDSSYNQLVANSSANASTRTSFEKPPVRRTLREKPSNENFNLNKLLQFNPPGPKASDEDPFSSEIGDNSKSDHNRSVNESKEPNDSDRQRIRPQPAGSSSRIAAPPPPLKLKDSLFNNSDKPNQSAANVNTNTSTHVKTPNSVQSFTHSPIMSPNSTNDDVVVIGAGSPSSIKSASSPSSRLFSRSRKNFKKPPQIEVKPTISSLSSPEKSVKERLQNPKKFTDLMEPPPIFGGITSIFNQPSKSSDSSSPKSSPKQGKLQGSPGNDPFISHSPQNSPKNHQPPSRKNSFSSIRSNGLTRITSSTSSLNLHAYLTDDAISLTPSRHQRQGSISSSSASENSEDSLRFGTHQQENEIILPSLPPPQPRSAMSPMSPLQQNLQSILGKSPQRIMTQSPTKYTASIQGSNIFAGSRYQMTPKGFASSDELNLGNGANLLDDIDDQADNTFIAGSSQRSGGSISPDATESFKYDQMSNGEGNPGQPHNGSNSTDNLDEGQTSTGHYAKDFKTMDQFLDRLD